VGGVILGLILAFVSYGIVRFLITRYKNARLKRLHDAPPPPTPSDFRIGPS